MISPFGPPAKAGKARTVLTSGVDKSAVGPALGKVPSCLAVVTCGRQAMLASWIQQASFEPPMVTIAVKSGRPILDALGTAGTLAISLLGEDSNKLLGTFAKPDDKALDKVDHQPSPKGHPVLRDAVAWMDCVVRQNVPAGDHVLCVCEIVGGAVVRDEKPRVHLRKNGFNY